MIPRHTSWSALLLAFAWSFGTAAQPVPTLDMNADGEVQIGVDGHVSDYRLHSQLTPTVAKLVDRDVRSWEFEPVLVDGVPVVAKTAMHLKLRAEPVAGADNYKIRIVEIHFGEPRRQSGVRPPHYPEGAISARAGAKVLLSIRLDETGKVADVLPYQTSLDVRTHSESEAENLRHLFERASLVAAHNWQFDMTETVNGKPIGTVVLVPVVYSLHGPGIQTAKDGEWKAYLPGPVHPVPWQHTREVADNASAADLPDGQARSLDSRFHLKQDMIGRLL